MSYCFLATSAPGTDNLRPMATHGKLVLFDTLAIAQQFLPLLGCGRTTNWALDGESVYWTPVDLAGINRAAIVTDYDPYDTPISMPGGIRSEAKGLEWRSHIMFSHAFFDCGQWVKRDGVMVNTALEG